MRLRVFIGGLILLGGFGPAGAVEEKLVIAHYMTDIIAREGKLNRWVDPELADPQGSTAAVGGLHQTVPLATDRLKGASLRTAVEFEIRAAQQLGIDGFQFYYPGVDNPALLDKGFNPVIQEFFRVCDEHYPEFKLTLCLSLAQSREGLDEKGKIERWSKSLRALLAEVGDSRSWLRSKSGARLFYLWVGDPLAEDVAHRAETPEDIRKVRAAYRRLAEAVGVPIDYIYQVRRPQIDPPYLDSITEEFAGVWGWTASEENPEFWEDLARRCRESGTLYTQTVYPDYYTSKVYAKGAPGHRILSTEEALELGVSGIERHYRVTGLAQTQIKLLERAVRLDVPIINYATWNDYPEGHHLAPEKNHNFGPGLLLRHFKREWLTGSKKVEGDEAIVFFKRYRHDVKPTHEVGLKIKSANKDLASEDRIELVTLLKAPAECRLNGHALGMVGAGLQVRSIASEAGSVRVEVIRGGETVIDFQTPEGITTDPLRTNRLTYAYSSAFDRECRKMFGAERKDGR
ncbi:hypothetical protein [Haloferula sp.]|uniref:hypothetical protein n=1 Tax=Haloferula sp. TaxID=2497595 RepID=UPI00329FC828